ncbi:Sensory box histidine kinase [Minicystis rosea]|nr:Sensory box histidine kinase [Minicystis rosea]
MNSPDWLLMVNRDGVVEAVDGGAPLRWIFRRVEACDGLPEGVLRAARGLVRGLAEPRAGTLIKRVCVPAEGPGAPSFTLLAVEAILLRPSEIEVVPFVRRALDPLAQQALAAAVTLRVEATADTPMQAAIDAPKIAWAVTALVGNALRYVRRGNARMPGGHIGVRLGHSAGRRMISITVEDDGPGMPADVQARLLGPSEEGDATGVSLRLVHEVVAAHGGGMVIKSSSAPDDRGTTITLWLPVRG